MVGFRCKYHGIVTLLARVGCSSTLQSGFKKRNSQELQLVQTRVLTWDDEIKSQWAKSPGYVFFFFYAYNLSLEEFILFQCTLFALCILYKACWKFASKLWRTWKKWNHVFLNDDRKRLHGGILEEESFVTKQITDFPL